VVNSREDFHLQDRAHAGRTKKGDPKAASFLLLLITFYFFLFINFTAMATTPPTASNGRMPGSGTTAAQAAAGSINISAVISF